MSTKHSQKEQLGRRKLLKSAAAGGGVAMAAAALPANWTKPVVDSILLPVHAQMSVLPITGVYTAAAVGLTMQKSHKSGIQYALLDALISPANAQTVTNAQRVSQHPIVDGICNNFGDMNPATIVFKINENATVDVAVTSNQTVTNSDQLTACTATTTIISNSMIADVTVPLDYDEFLTLTNMVADEFEVIGDWMTGSPSDNHVPCGGNFIAPLGGSFPSAIDCSNVNAPV